METIPLLHRDPRTLSLRGRSLLLHVWCNDIFQVVPLCVMVGLRLVVCQFVMKTAGFFGEILVPKNKDHSGNFMDFRVHTDKV